MNMLELMTLAHTDPMATVRYGDTVMHYHDHSYCTLVWVISWLSDGNCNEESMVFTAGAVVTGHTGTCSGCHAPLSCPPDVKNLWHFYPTAMKHLERRWHEHS